MAIKFTQFLRFSFSSLHQPQKRDIIDKENVAQVSGAKLKSSASRDAVAERQREEFVSQSRWRWTDGRRSTHPFDPELPQNNLEDCVRQAIATKTHAKRQETGNDEIITPRKRSKSCLSWAAWLVGFSSFLKDENPCLCLGSSWLSSLGCSTRYRALASTWVWERGREGRASEGERGVRIGTGRKRDWVRLCVCMCVGFVTIFPLEAHCFTVCDRLAPRLQKSEDGWVNSGGKDAVDAKIDVLIS